MSALSPSLKELFLAALAIAPAERAAWLERECGQDATLRHQIELMLAAHDMPQSLLDSPALVGDRPERTSGTGTGATVEAAGMMIGPYKLLQQIGEGGMGTVFMAEQVQPVVRKVALKLIKPGMDSRQVVARFEAERQALAMMDHVNIARVFDAGTTESGRPYFVMELVHGVPITKYCDDKHLTPRERLELFVPVCQAIKHAHQKGIIHRDVKASNVMITLYDGKPVPKVIDFGVAKATEQKLTERTLFTQYGTMVGTLEYMSPEQAEMSALGVDTRSDIYSLGVLLYELLTGTTPLSRERMKEAALGEILRIIKEEEPQKPSTRLSTSGETLASISAKRSTEPARMSKLVKGELDWIVMKAIEKDRNQRYESASAFAADIERYLSDEPVLACPPSARYRLRKFARKNRTALTTAATISLLLIAGAAISTWQAVRATKAEGLAQERLLQVTAEKERADEERSIAVAVSEFLQKDLLGQAAPQANARNKKITVEELLGRAAARVDTKFVKQPRIEVAILRTIGNTYRAMGDYPAAQPRLERVVENSTKILGKEHPDTLISMLNLAELYSDQGHYDKAELLAFGALEAQRRVLGEEHPDTLTSMNRLAGFYYLQGQYAKAEPLYIKSLEVSRRVLGEDHPETLLSMNDLAQLYVGRRLYTKAEPLFLKSLERRRRVLGEEHPDTLYSMQGLGSLYRYQGKDAEAEPLLLKALETSGRVMGKEHPDTLTSMDILAHVYVNQKQYEKAEELYLKSLEIKRRVLGEEHPFALTSRRSLAQLYQTQHQFAKAEPLLIKLIESNIRVRGEEHPKTLLSMNTLGTLYMDQGQYAKAEPVCLRSLELARRTQRREHHDISTEISNMANTYASQGKYDLAEPLWRELLLPGQPKDEDGPAYAAANAQAGLGEILMKQRKFSEAEPLLRDCVSIRSKNVPEAWQTFNAMSVLGGCLLGQKKYPEAEPLLVQGYDGMKNRESKIPAHGKIRLTEAAERLVKLYEVTNQPEKARLWREKLPAIKDARDSK